MEKRKFTTVQRERLYFSPKVPNALQQLRFDRVLVAEGGPTEAEGNKEDIQELFPLTYGQPALVIKQSSTKSTPKPLRVGIVLSGGQAAGGHNVISGLFDYLKIRNKDSKLFGFLGGPIGIIKGKYIELTEDLIDKYRNQGGFDIIGTGRDKIEKSEEFKSSYANCSKLNLNGVVIVGGDDSNTNAAVLSEYFLKMQKEKGESLIQVIGVPKTIDGDLQSPKGVEMSFGFDSATKVYASLIGNIETDCLSAKKYYHFVRLMGRSASHITLECALRTRPNITLIGEEVAEKKQTLREVTNYICDVINERSKLGKDYGVVLLPEGLIEFIPEINQLISEINEILSSSSSSSSSAMEIVAKALTPNSKLVFDFLPKEIKTQLLLDRDPHGNVQVSKIETEKLLIQLIEEELALRKSKKQYSGKFAALSHFFGYEGRCVLPSNFDANYCYALGRVVGILIESSKTGYIASIRNLHDEIYNWKPIAVPLTSMMNVERRKGKNKPVIRKALVLLDGRPFNALVKRRKKWELNDCYVNPGPIQFHGASADSVPVSLMFTWGDFAKKYHSSL